jgi:hypothetical protein
MKKAKEIILFLKVRVYETKHTFRNDISKSVMKYSVSLCLKKYQIQLKSFMIKINLNCLIFLEILILILAFLPINPLYISQA